MCIIHRIDKAPYRCLGCLPIEIPAFFVFALECCLLYADVILFKPDVQTVLKDMSEFDIIVNSILVFHFFVAAVFCNNVYVRQSLFICYLVLYVVWAIGFFYLLFTKPFDDIVYDAAVWLNSKLPVGANYVDFIANELTLAYDGILLAYFFILSMIKLICMQVMYFYFKELKE